MSNLCVLWGEERGESVGVTATPVGSAMMVELDSLVIEPGGMSGDTVD